MLPEIKQAQVVLSGGFERRRGYLSTMMYTLNQVTISTVAAIWVFLLRFDTVMKPTGTDWTLLANEAAWAGALSSVVIGFWRLFGRELDADIIRLYPAIYLCERTLLPPEVCTIKPPQGMVALPSVDSSGVFEYKNVSNAAFGGRLHGLLDWLGVSLIVGFSLLSVAAGLKSGMITLVPFGRPHRIGFMLFGNVTGLVLIIGAYAAWVRKKVLWPVAVKSTAPPNPPLQPTSGAGTAT